MIYRGLLSFLLLLPIAGCGSPANDQKSVKGQFSNSQETDAVVLDYDIRVDNVPLMGSQIEVLELTIADFSAKYSSSVKLSLTEETREIKRLALLDFRDSSQTTVNFADSTYNLVIFAREAAHRLDFDSTAAAKKMPERQFDIELIPSREIRDINEFTGCHQIKIISVMENSDSARAGVDSSTMMEGELWLKSDLPSSAKVTGYYKRLSRYFEYPHFIGFEIWRVLEKLGIPREVLRKLLFSLDGVLVQGDFICDMPTPGKMANIKVSVKLRDLTAKKLPVKAFEIPMGFRPSFKAEGSH